MRGTRCGHLHPDFFKCFSLQNVRSPPMPRILVVEDDVATQLFIEHVLVGAGYEVDAAGTMSGGTDLLRCRRYDLVLLDVKLPDGIGLEIAHLAREKVTQPLTTTGHPF